jgi:putative phage-type endonuclease
MRNTFATLRPERVRPALELVNTSQPTLVDLVATQQAGITASEAAAAVGCDPTKSQAELWREKTGQQPEHPNMEPHDETHPTYWKTLLEPLVAAVYTKRTGHRLRRVNTVLCHPSHPWMLVHMGWEVMDVPGAQILQCLNVGGGEMSWWRDGMPAHLQVNVQHMLAVTGASAADIAVLMCGQELQIHHIKRNDLLIGRLVQLESRFWGYVQRNEPPPISSGVSCMQ